MFDNIWVYFPTFSPYISLRYPKSIWVHSVYTWMAWLRKSTKSTSVGCCHILWLRKFLGGKKSGCCRHNVFLCQNVQDPEPVDRFIDVCPCLHYDVWLKYQVVLQNGQRWISMIQHPLPFQSILWAPKKMDYFWQYKFEVVVEQRCLVIYSYLPWNLGVSWSDLTNGWRPKRQLSVSLDCYSYSHI